MKYKAYRSDKEAASAPIGFASPEWALGILQSSPEVTAIECRVPSDKRFRKALSTWAVEVSTYGVKVTRHDGGEVGWDGETGRISFTGTPVEMARLVAAALSRYKVQVQVEEYLNG